MGYRKLLLFLQNKTKRLILKLLFLDGKSYFH